MAGKKTVRKESDVIKSDAYMAGRRARIKKIPRSANPYAHGTQKKTDWRKGWSSVVTKPRKPKAAINCTEPLDKLPQIDKITI